MVRLAAVALLLAACSVTGTAAQGAENGTLSGAPPMPASGGHQQHAATGTNELDGTQLQSGTHQQHVAIDVRRGRRLSGLDAAVYSNSSYVDDFGELLMVEASLSWLNLTWVRMTSMTSLPPVSFLIVPELEMGQPPLGSIERTALLNFTWNGGRLISMGHPNNMLVLNYLFGWSVTGGGGDSGMGTLQAPYNTSWSGWPWPNTVQLLSATFSSTNLSGSANVIYRNPNSDATVWYETYGAGGVYYLGFDWYTQDQQWDCVLGQMVNVNCWAGLPPTTLAPSTTRTTTVTTSATTTTTETITSTDTTTTTVTATTSATTTATVSTSTSSTMTTSTSTVTAALTAEKQVDLLLGAVQAAEEQLLSTLLNSDANSTVVTITGGTVLAVKLGALAAGVPSNESVVVPAPDGIVVSVPGSLFGKIGSSDVAGDSLAMTVTAFDDSTLSSLGSGQGSTPGLAGVAGDGQEVASVTVGAALNVDMSWLLSSSDILVQDLEDPIELEIPINRSSHFGRTLVCAYWNENTGGWATDGVSAVPSADGPLVCLTRHLSLFGAIWLGFQQTFLCAQLGLFSSAAIERLAEGRWYALMGASAFFSVLIILLGSLTVAAYLDSRRRKEYSWTANFLVVPAAIQSDRASTPDEAEENEEERKEARIVACFKGIFCGIASVLLVCCDWMRHSSAVREAVDDVLSSWSDRFADLRGILEGCFEALTEGGLEIAGVGGAGATGRVFVLSHRVMSNMLIRTSRQLASFDLGISEEVTEFVLGDEDLHDYLVEHQAKLPPEPEPEVESPQHRKQEPPPDWRKCESPKEAWKFLHQAVINATTMHVRRNGCGNMPLVIWELFLAQNPFGTAFSLNIFTSCKLRVLFMSMDILGALALASFFTQSSGSVKRRSVGSCSASSAAMDLEDSIGFKLGRLFAIALGSVLLSGLPVMVVETLHTASFRRLEEEGGNHKVQLKAWRLQEAFVWVFGGAYVAFCTLFILVFLANLEEKDHLTWAIGGVLTVLNDSVVLPLLLALVVPTLGDFLLSFLCYFWSVDRMAVVRATQEKFHASTMLPLSHV